MCFCQNLEDFEDGKSYENVRQPGTKVKIKKARACFYVAPQESCKKFARDSDKGPGNK